MHRIQRSGLIWTVFPIARAGMNRRLNAGNGYRLRVFPADGRWMNRESLQRTAGHGKSVFPASHW